MTLQDSKVARILAVDDSPDNLFLVQTILEDKGYQVNLAVDGRSALARIEASPPDLILLDVMMPGMDGYEVTRRIRKNQDKLGFIPILLITAHQQSSVVEGLDAGADDFIRKPVDMDELLARVRALLRLKYSIDEQQRMSRQREDFVSRLTHDLRTPLVAADRMMNLFLEEAFGPVVPEMAEALTVMIRSNRNLLQMVNTLLEVYRHDAGSKTLTFAQVDLLGVVQEVVQELAPLVETDRLTIQISLDHQGNDGAVNTTVLGDRLELRRVMMNLVGNAIKFTDRGSITIRLANDRGQSVGSGGSGGSSGLGGSDDAHPSNHAWLRLEVVDTGTGIPFEDQINLFERFRQGENKRAGSGLGLYLSRRIVEAHRGLIGVTSEPHQGSIFYICLPLYTP
ncbi:MAG: HAMP domain-containing histidine kinase [Elainella sp. Prado103]|jgi:signal transduction histidine kinase|nr:HAMP domain-containing histidine kinase [Elainella sp. Prado103]